MEGVELYQMWINKISLLINETGFSEFDMK